MSRRNYSTLQKKKKTGGKSLISIISRISLRVTQHHSNHRGKEMASFHAAWRKKKRRGGRGALIAGESERESIRGEAALAPFTVNAFPEIISLSQIRSPV